MTATKREWFIRNVAEVPWREFPNHFGGALSKPLVMPETAVSRAYRLSYLDVPADGACRTAFPHKVQEQIYHVLEGERHDGVDGKDVMSCASTMSSFCRQVSRIPSPIAASSISSSLS